MPDAKCPPNVIVFLMHYRGYHDLGGQPAPPPRQFRPRTWKQSSLTGSYQVEWAMLRPFAELGYLYVDKFVEDIRGR